MKYSNIKKQDLSLVNMANMIEECLFTAVSKYPGEIGWLQFNKKLKPMYIKGMLNFLNITEELLQYECNKEQLLQVTVCIKKAIINEFYPNVKETIPRYQWLSVFLQDSFIKSLNVYLEKYNNSEFKYGA